MIIHVQSIVDNFLPIYPSVSIIVIYCLISYRQRTLAQVYCIHHRMSIPPLSMQFSFILRFASSHISLKHLSQIFRTFYIYPFEVLQRVSTFRPLIFLSFSVCSFILSYFFSNLLSTYAWRSCASFFYIFKSLPEVLSCSFHIFAVLLKYHIGKCTDGVKVGIRLLQW